MTIIESLRRNKNGIIKMTDTEILLVKLVAAIEKEVDNEPCVEGFTPTSEDKLRRIGKIIKEAGF